MILRPWWLAMIVAFGLLMPPWEASADTCDGSGSAGEDFIDVGVVCQQPGATDPAQPSTPVSDSSDSPYIQYRWASMCTLDPLMPPASVDCTASMTCGQPDLRRWQLWGQLENKSWRVIRSQCFGGKPPPYKPPKVTPAMVLSALRRVGLPEPTIHVQPDTKTLVNLDTIFWTEPQRVDLDLTILGQAVEVQANPTSFHWVFGDGADRTTAEPGQPYPHKDVTHRYADADVTTHPHVETVYTARFRVGDGDWQDIDETVTVPGPATELRVVEGTPLLTGGRH